MKQTEVIQKLHEGKHIIVSRGLYPHAIIDGKTVNWNTFAKLEKETRIEQYYPSKYNSLIEYYRLKQ